MYLPLTAAITWMSLAGATKLSGNYGNSQGFAYTDGRYEYTQAPASYSPGYAAQEMYHQTLPSYQPAPGESFLAVSAGTQQIENFQPSMQGKQRFIQESVQQTDSGESFQTARGEIPPQPRMQPESFQQASFLAASSQADTAATVMNRLTEVMQQQSRALMSLEAEQHQLASVETKFAERSLALIESLAVVPKCKDFKAPAEVKDDSTCDKACATQNAGYTNGDYVQNTWEGISGWLGPKTNRCDCRKQDGAKKTICTDGAKMTTSLLGPLTLIVLMVHRFI